MSLKTRVGCHVSAARTNNPRGCPVFHAAIRKYGKPEFTEIDATFSKEELSYKEKYWIRELDAQVPRGYNVAEGGHNGKVSFETKKKMSISRRGSKNPRYGKPRSDSVRRKISETKSGTALSDEHKEKIRKTCGSKEFRESMSLTKSSLSLAEMKTVQELYATGKHTQQTLAHVFDVGRNSIRTALSYDKNKFIGV